MLKKKTGYQVGDQWFDKKSDAAAHMALVNLDRMLDEYETSALDLKDWMIAKHWVLIGVLSDIARRGAATKKEAA